MPYRLHHAAHRCIAALAFALIVGQLSPAHAAGSTPSRPDDLAGSIVGTTVSLTWEASTDDEGVEGYNVYRDDRYISTVFDTAYTGAVEADTRYVFKVVAFDARPRNFSPSSDALTLPASLVPSDLTVPPTTPTDLTGTVDGTIVMLAWTASTDDEAVRGYNVYRDDRYVGTRFEPGYVGNVEAGRVHRWYVVAFDIRNNFSARSASITLPDEGPVDTSVRPEPPEGLTGTVDAGTATDGVTLTWTDAIDDRGVAGYNVYRNGRYVGTRFGTEYSGTVDAGSSNAFSVVTFDIDGNFSVASKRLVLPEGPGSTNPGVPPSVPTGLEGSTVTADGSTTVTLTWQASTSTAAVAGYNVYRDNDYLATVSDVRFVDTVPAGRAFSYAVVAYDDFGNFSAKSARLSLFGPANQAPFFSDLGDRTLEAGVAFELRLRPVDLDGGAAGILTSALPSGMANVDNGDGSRSLVWTPAATDVGAYEITVTAFDLQDTDLRTARTITLTVVDEGAAPSDTPFGISIAAGAFGLREGDAAGVEIPVSIVRDDGYAGSVELGVAAQDPDDESLVSATFSPAVLGPDVTESTLTLVRDIAIQPIRPRQSGFVVTASDGTASDTASVTVAVSPTERDDVYLLLGQSNMVGFSETGAKRAGPGEPDAPVLRLRQLNATANERERFALAGRLHEPGRERGLARHRHGGGSLARSAGSELAREGRHDDRAGAVLRQGRPERHDPQRGARAGRLVGYRLLREHRARCAMERRHARRPEPRQHPAVRSRGGSCRRSPAAHRGRSSRHPLVAGRGGRQRGLRALLRGEPDATGGGASIEHRRGRARRRCARSRSARALRGRHAVARRGSARRLQPARRQRGDRRRGPQGVRGARALRRGLASRRSGAGERFSLRQRLVHPFRFSGPARDR